MLQICRKWVGDKKQPQMVKMPSKMVQKTLVNLKYVKENKMFYHCVFGLCTLYTCWLVLMYVFCRPCNCVETYLWNSWRKEFCVWSCTVVCLVKIALEWAITVPFNLGMGWLSIPLPLFSTVSSTPSPLCCARAKDFPCWRPLKRHWGIVSLRTALSIGCLQQRKALSVLRAGEMNWERERGEIVVPQASLVLESSEQCGDGSHRRASRSSLVSFCHFSK